ncbi:CBS domain-containing protein [Ferrimonas senticii]|uniref:CBS domain-containing protein n=1 Tax=Ferrimonas senticii TaxID=394566 RepID=UPI00146A3783|nr:CBS domain-containing protein [Ferrimonas senticii]
MINNKSRLTPHSITKLFWRQFVHCIFRLGLEPTMKLEKKLVSDIMDRNPLVLSTTTTVATALQLFAQHNIECAPVVDQQMRLVGIFSSHDLLVHFWSINYAKHHQEVSVEMLMRTEVETAHASDSVLQLAERMCIDHEQLYAVSDSGFLTTMSPNPIEQRARTMKVAKPKQFPVVKDHKLIGMVSRAMVANSLLGLCHQHKTSGQQVA